MPEEEQLKNGSADSVLEPKTVVLAKVKGYPPWPAMILDETILPDYMLQKKPKNVRQPAKKKKAKPVIIYPVRFFSDDTYIWIKDSDLKSLDSDTIHKHLGNDRRRKDKLLDEAYTMALDPPDMELFVKYGSKAAPDDPPPEEDSETGEYVNDEDELDDEDDSEDIEDIDDEEDESLDEEEDYGAPPRKRRALAKKPVKNGSNGSTKSRSKAKAKAKAKAKTPTKGKAEPKETVADEAVDSDWGLDEWSFNYDENNYIFDDVKKQRDFVEQFPKASEVQSRYNKYVGSFQKISTVLISNLLSDTPDIDATLEALRGLENILDLPKSIFLKSTLLKVLIITVRKPTENFPYPKVKKKAASILHSLLGLSVASTSMEDLAKWEEEVRKKEIESQPPALGSNDGTPMPAISNGSNPPISVQQTVE